MTTPTPERIAAALALAEAADAAARACDAPEGTPPEVFTRTWFARCEALAAYRATAPKPLRTRAEVDADIAAKVRGCTRRDGLLVDGELLKEARRLCLLVREPTADPQPYGSSSDESASSPRVDAAAGAAYSGPRPTPATKESSDTAGVEAGAANRIADHDADQREVEACSCEESEALKDELKECRQLLDYARRCAQDIVTVLDEARK